jgi:hypothetical protein
MTRPISTDEPGIAEPVEADVSADLAFELQSKLFDQLAGMGLAGAGLVITLAGSILQGKPLIWLAAVEFGLVAIVSLTAQQHLIEGIFRRSPTRRRSRIMTGLAILLLGMGVGSLGASVFLLSPAHEPPPATFSATRP